MVELALLQPIKNSRDLQKAILTYNSIYDWKFTSLHKLFEEDLDEQENADFFENTLPKMIRLALQLPDLVPGSIPLLKQDRNSSISLTQQQIACLLANAFLCTYPRRNTRKKKSEYDKFPQINFNRLFQSDGQCVVEKIKCICWYFRRVCNEMPIGVLTFQRRSIKEPPNWQKVTTEIGSINLHVTSTGTIEKDGKGLLQVDFANKYLGGGVLGSGCVQEEIRFVICPELLISLLFTEVLKPNEALLMIGCEQFSEYHGYASSFTWKAPHEDNTPFDSSRRKQCNVIAIDAISFSSSSWQFKEELILREINKANVGFKFDLMTRAPGVASGNWGCGAFGGEPRLKALIQLIACVANKRSLVYFTFGDSELRDEIHEVFLFLKENKITIAQLLKYLFQFRSHKLEPENLYPFLYQLHKDKVQKSKSILSKIAPIFNVAPKLKPFYEPLKFEITTTSSIQTKDVEMKEVYTKKNFDEAGPSKKQPSLLESLDEFYNKENPIKKKCTEKLLNDDENNSFVIDMELNDNDESIPCSPLPATSFKRRSKELK